MDVLARRLFPFIAIGGLLLSVGCGSNGKNEDFTPASEKGRKALVAALDHWKAGKNPGSIPETNPKVEVVDFQWRNGQMLKSYEIISDTPPVNGQGPRIFTVKLTLVQGQTIETQFMVLGIDPLWVYRKEDFAKLSG